MPVIVILPPFGLSSRSCLSLGKELSQKYHVIIPDLNKNSSFFSTTAGSFENYAHFLHLFVTRLNVKQFDLLGLSFGGAIAVTYAQLYPASVKRLLLASTSLFPLKKSLLAFGYSFLKLLWNNSFSSQGLITNAQWLIGGCHNVLRHPIQILFDTLMVTRKSKQKINSIEVPTLLFLAKEDEFIPTSLVEEMRKIKNVKIKITGVHHPWFFTNRELLIKELW